MLGQYFYHEIIRKTVIAFGTLFNNIELRTKNADGTYAQQMKVPLAYGPMEKFLALVEQQATYKNRVQITLPRMAFEMTGISYDPSRKTTVTKAFCAGTQDSAKKVYMPVPYNLNFVLSIATKQNDDMLQIIEQILPYFQPAFSVTVNMVDSIGEKKDIPIILDNIQMTTDYEGNFTDNSTIIYNLLFTAKTYVFGAIASETSGLIKKVDVDYHMGLQRNAPRQIRYSVTPKAVKDYDNDAITQITEDIDLKETIISINDASTFSVKDYIEVGSETMEIVSVDGNTIKVKRGVEGTGAQKHYTGDAVNAITILDDALIPLGDDFGFNETTSFFTDFKTYNPVTGEDA
jgi:hypothetical protein